MSSVNHQTKELGCKIVYYGPALCGKTTNVQSIYENTPAENRGQLTSLKTSGDRTLYFDLLPLKLGTIKGYKVRIHLYTVPGQVHHNVTRKMVLKGVDGVVFVADSTITIEENLESLQNLQTNLKDYGVDLMQLPLVQQLNKRDLPSANEITEMESRLRVKNEKFFEASALNGQGVFETLKEIVKLVLEVEKQSNLKDVFKDIGI